MTVIFALNSRVYQVNILLPIQQLTKYMIARIAYLVFYSSAIFYFTFNQRSGEKGRNMQSLQSLHCNWMIGLLPDFFKPVNLVLQ